MSRPANLTESASGFSRLPWQTGQSALDRNCATRRFIIALCVRGEGLQDVFAGAR